MLSHLSSQQDRGQLHWQGTVAATNGSVDRSSKRMGAGVVLLRNGAFLPPIKSRVGWPLATFCPEAAALHCLLDFTAPGEDLLVFTDSLDLLQAECAGRRATSGPVPMNTATWTSLSPSSPACANALVSHA